MKPKTILWFDRLFWTSMILSAALVIYSLWHIRAEFEAELGAVAGAEAYIAFGAVLAGGAIAIAVVYGISILLWFFASQRASNTARWIYAVVTGLGAVTTPLGLFDVSAAEVVMSLLVMSLSIATIVTLFLPRSNVWFRSGGAGSAEDIGAFE